MRVLHVSTHMNIGGIGSYILSLAKALKKKGVDVIVASSGGDLEPELLRSGIRHIRLDIRTKSELSPKVLKSIFTLNNIARREGVDIIHAHTRVSQVVSFFSSRLASVPYVTTCHGFFRTRMRKVFDTWGKKVIAISDAVANHLRDDLGVKAGRIEVIYSGVDIGFFSKEYSAAEREEIKKSLGLGPGPIAGSIGRLSPVKGHRFFIEAMCGVIARTPSAEALIAGSGPEEASLKQFVKSLGFDDRVHFERPNTDTRKLLAVMDVFVFPSVKEGLGIGLLEALCAKKACVGTDIGGIKDIIDDGVNGILVPSGDISAMSKAITGLFNDEKKRSLIAERGQKSVRDRFSLDDMASGVIRLYEDVLKG